MNGYRARVILIFSGWGIGSLFGAETLQWEQRVIEKTAARHEIVKAAFRFTNASDRLVTITSVTPSCDCTTVELKKNTFSPGEQGQIDIVFNVADSTGQQDKTITVTTAESPNDPTELLLKVKIPLLVEITPRLLTWKVGEAATEKSVEISLAAAPVITVTGAQSKDPEMQTRLEAIVPHRKYRLVVKPVSTAHPRRSTFIIMTLTAGSDSPEAITVYGQIR
jgi:hypothetical protein